ncbi:putative transcription factor/ chromatin remodeling BED-type(Zn) family [Helianthus anomalus]
MACNGKVEVVMVMETKRNPSIWKHFDLCLMIDNYEMARCKGCGKFMKATNNSTLKKYFDRHCPVTKAKKMKRVKDPGPVLQMFSVFDVSRLFS